MLISANSMVDAFYWIKMPKLLYFCLNLPGTDRINACNVFEPDNLISIRRKMSCLLLHKGPK